MVHRRHVHRRQAGVDIPTASGINGASTVDGSTASPAGNSLVVDTSTNTHSQTAIPFVSTPVTILTTPTTSSSDTEGAPAPTDVQQTVSQNGGSQIPLSTVIGACVGALVGALALILLGLWIYKRSAPKPRQRNPVSYISASRNARGEVDRSRSRMEVWDKLGDNEDKWEGQYQTQEIPRSASVGPMEKLTMFKKSPSVRTADTDRSYDAHFEEPHPFAQYHPNLAQELATESNPPVRQYLGRVDAGPALSWDSGNASFLSLNSGRDMSPSLDVARPTPDVIMGSGSHHWESAEVLNYDGEELHSNNPFVDDGERRKSISNPFFGAQSHAGLPRTSPRSSLRSYKGKDKDDGKDPFADQDIPSVPKIRQVQVSSMSSETSNDRAIQNLIAALDFSGTQGPLRVASIQPSVYSTNSVYTEEEDVTDAFPLPPGVGR
jgi:hypothetical protein